MLELTLDETIAKIRNRQLFEARICDGSFYVKINKYVPYACFAIHNGHQLSEELQQFCALNEYERWYEEDPNTLDFIEKQPIVIASNDSRYAFDLNRNMKEAIYDVAWGKKVWAQPLSAEIRKKQLAKHQAFYRLVEVLLSSLQANYSRLVLFDMHSFNYLRMQNEAPVINVGTVLIQNVQFRPWIDKWLDLMETIVLNDLPVTVSENEVWVGDGYFAEYVNKNYPDTLVLVNEIKKVYCNELNGEIYNSFLKKFTQQFNACISEFTKLNNPASQL